VVEIYGAGIYEMELREEGIREEEMDAKEVGWKQDWEPCWLRI
jgi:hypothetical protein